MYRVIKSILFLFPAEKAHYLTVYLLNCIVRFPLLNSLWIACFRLENSDLEVDAFGLHFKNPIGLAAGFDKNGDYIKAMASLGFGFIEVGTVTPLPQSGNPKPRLFRLKADQAVINRMGFNNLGVDYLVQNLSDLGHRDLIIGGNIGKNKTTPNSEAWKDYLICFDKLYDHVDFFVVNLSSPNTPGLRELQEKEPLKKILSALLTSRVTQKISKPILLKIAPDINSSLLDDILSISEELNIDGIIATNTTISRDDLTTDANKLEAIGAGGLSGAPLRTMSDDLIRRIKTKKSKIPVIGVGGIVKPDHAIQKLQDGASLVQLYTGLIYAGPFLIKRIKQSILKGRSK